jgi:hypothetical protein
MNAPGVACWWEKHKREVYGVMEIMVIFGGWCVRCTRYDGYMPIWFMDT